MSGNGTTKGSELWEDIVLGVIGIALFGAALSVFLTSTWLPLLLGVVGLVLIFTGFLSLAGGLGLLLRACTAADDLTTLKTLRTEMKDCEVVRVRAYGNDVYSVEVIVGAFNRKRSKQFRIDKETYNLLKNARLRRTLQEVLGSEPEPPEKD